MDGATESGTAEAPPDTTKDMSGMAGGMSGTDSEPGGDEGAVEAEEKTE